MGGKNIVEKYLIYLTYIVFIIIVMWGIKKEKNGIVDKQEYLNRMNLFRGIFALDIIIGHVAGQNMLPLMPFEKFSIVSVAGFFFLSGSGLANSFHKKEKYLREMPKKITYLLCVTLCLFLIKIGVQYFLGYNLIHIPDSFSAFGKIYFETTNWYIWELILLYITFTVIYGIMYQKANRGCVLAIIAITFLIGVGLALNGTIVAWYYSILGFPFGILFYEYFDSFISFIHKWYGQALIAFFMVGGIIGHLLFTSSNVIASYITRNMFCLACIMIIILLIEQVKFDNRVIRCLTNISLEFYLYQSLWLGLTQSIASDYNVRMLVVIGGTFVTALLVHPINKCIKKGVSRIFHFVYSHIDDFKENEKIVSNSRLKIWDIVKGIAIFLVVIGHLLEQTFCVGKEVQRVIVFSHMPVFFFCSGFFLIYSINKHSRRMLLAEKIKKLIVPYICWSFIAFCANVLLSIQNGEIIQTVQNEFWQIFIYARSVWFLVVLFIAQFIGIYLVFLSEHVHVSKYIILISGWIIISICMPSEYFSMYKFKWLFPFLIMGMYYAEKKDKLGNISKYGLAALSFPLICIVLYKPLYYEKYLEFNYSNIKEIGMGLVYYMVSLLGIAFVFECATLLNRGKLGDVFAYMGKHSMEIYVMHMLFIKFIVFVPLQLYNNDSMWTYIYIILYATIIIGLILFLSRNIFNRFKIYNIIVGKEEKR